MDGSHSLLIRSQQFGTQMPQGGHPPHHSITSSAATSRPGGTVSPIDFAVLTLATVSNFVGASTGSSAGLAPRRMRSTYAAAWRYRYVIDGVGHEAAGEDEGAERVDRRQPVLGGKRDDEVAVQNGRAVRRERQPANRPACEIVDRALDIGGGLHLIGHQLDPERGRCRFGALLVIVKRACLGIAQQSDAREAGRDLLEHRPPSSPY